MQMGQELQLNREGKLFVLGVNNIKTGSMYVGKLVEEFENIATTTKQGKLVLYV